MLEIAFRYLVVTLALMLPIYHGTVQLGFYPPNEDKLWPLNLSADEINNTSPIASDDFFSISEDLDLMVSAPGVLENDSDLESDPLTAIKVSDPAHGSLTLNNDGSFTYSPDTNYVGPDSFTYKANDGQADSNVAVVTITITPVNDQPKANPQEITVAEDNSVEFVLTASDVDNEELIFSVVTQPTHGILTGTPPYLTYTPDENFFGLDSFTFKVNDGQLDSEVATVSITVTAVNDAPIATNDTYMMDEDAVLNILAPGVLSNDQDVEGDVLSVELVNNVSHGGLTLNTTGGFTYTPIANYYGTDSFIYRAYDGQLYSNVAVATITINNLNDPPLALDDSYTIAEDTLLNIPAPGILSNDTDPEGRSLSASKVSDPTHGSLILNSNGEFTYSPASNYYGPDSFTYVANDGQLSSNVATVNITVTPVNDAPVANSQTKTVAEDGSTVIVLTGADVDEDALTFTVVTQPAHGTLSGLPPSLTYTPNPDYSGSDSFTFKISDGQVDSNVAMVSITVTPVNDAPVALSDVFSVNEDTVLSVTTLGVLINDQDADGDVLSALLVSNVDHGTLTLNTNGGFIYIPSKDYNGSDSFTYFANDGQANSNPATVTLIVNPINDAPVVVDDTYRANILGILVSNPNVLGNDSDVDQDNLSVDLRSTPIHGVLNINNNGNFTYVPTPDYRGTDSFTYRAYDGKAYSVLATVTIEVDSVRPLPPDWIQPVGNESIYIMREDTVTLGVTTYDTDINYVRFQWWNPVSNNYELLGVDTESPFSVALNFSRLPVNQLSQVFAEVWDDFGNVSLNTLNQETYLQTVRRIFIFPTTFRNQIYLPLIFK
ncbi:Ig-like domain-containing protein [Thermanaerothrix sp. 4228-RoL]|uniref:Ig-like domain-containing protein n=1 Tax=Thermanaerothrix solaris TaxID=3058434 RepID=A0ABU3NJG1_9CHLR|nr:Ig-like domain-containing protein [Thermanaerothrix sp. 4228-RoL]MDT8896990.1 Ig-like domain-containing protein [Thermanaerothrix sp. 4228-RoL]